MVDGRQLYIVSLITVHGGIELSNVYDLVPVRLQLSCLEGEGFELPCFYIHTMRWKYEQLQ